MVSPEFTKTRLEGKGNSEKERNLSGPKLINEKITGMFVKQESKDSK